MVMLMAATNIKLQKLKIKRRFFCTHHFMVCAPFTWLFVLTFYRLCLCLCLLYGILSVKVSRTTLYSYIIQSRKKRLCVIHIHYYLKKIVAMHLLLNQVIVFRFSSSFANLYVYIVHTGQIECAICFIAHSVCSDKRVMWVYLKYI